MKNLIKTILRKQGFDPALYPIAKHDYQGPNVAFIHISKSGGISIDQAIRRAIAAPNQRRIDKYANMYASVASFDRPIDTLEAQCQFGQHHAINLAKILSQYLSLNWRYISGHVTVNQQVLTDFQQQYRFITVLRHPVDRFISNYIFNKLTNTTAYMPPQKAKKGEDIIAEAEILLSSERGWQMANANTMYLTGRYPKNIHEAEQMQAEFSENLSRFSIVGFLDNLPAFAQQFNQLTGRAITIGQHNTTKAINDGYASKVKAQLQNYFNEPSTQNKLAILCQAEIANYQRAQEKYA